MRERKTGNDHESTLSRNSYQYPSKNPNLSAICATNLQTQREIAVATLKKRIEMIENNKDEDFQTAKIVRNLGKEDKYNSLSRRKDKNKSATFDDGIKLQELNPFMLLPNQSYTKEEDAISYMEIQIPPNNYIPQQFDEKLTLNYYTENTHIDETVLSTETLNSKVPLLDNAAEIAAVEKSIYHKYHEESRKQSDDDDDDDMNNNGTINGEPIYANDKQVKVVTFCDQHLNEKIVNDLLPSIPVNQNNSWCSTTRIQSYASSEDEFASTHFLHTVDPSDIYHESVYKN